MARLTGRKWGPSENGASGGVVTWSIIDAGVSGVIDGFDTDGDAALGHDVTDDAQAVTGFDVTKALQQAFGSWSAVADITFLQVEDGGDEVTEGASADIRVAFGHLDGFDGRTLGLAYFPDEDDVRGGDILFDGEEYTRASDELDFIGVAAHEVGHSLGLAHTNNIGVLMNPVTVGIFEPQDDDIRGARRIYGEANDAAKTLRLSRDVPDVNVLEQINDLRIIGTGDDNVISGSGGAQDIRGLGGDDDLSGKGGADRLIGGGGADTLTGGGGADRLIAGGGADRVNGGGRGEFIKGGGGGDILNGGGGDDEIFGNGGADTMAGGRGDDTLTGGGGRDVFVLERKSGVDRFADVNLRKDKIDATGLSAVSSLDDLTITNTDAGAELSFRGSALATLDGVAADQVAADLFIFAEDAPLPAPQEPFTPPEPPEEIMPLNLIGSGADEALTGGEANDFIDGLGGRDTLSGGQGDDTIVADGDNDAIFGGLGADVFVLEPSGADGQPDFRNIIATLKDFTVGEDKIDVTAFTAVRGADDLEIGYVADRNITGDLYLQDNGERIAFILIGDSGLEGQLTADDFIFADDHIGDAGDAHSHAHVDDHDNHAHVIVKAEESDVLL